MRQGAGLLRFVATTFVALTVGAGVAMRLTIAPEPVVINVRWAAGLGDPERAALERRFALTSGRQLEGATWQYRLVDPSSGNIRRLVEHPPVADTHGLDRARFRPVDTPAGSTRSIAVRAIAIGAVGSLMLVLLRLGLPVATRAARRAVSLPPVVLAALVGAAPAFLAIAGAAAVVVAAAGIHPLWRLHPAPTLVEAAYQRDRAEVTRLVAGGANLDAPGAIDGVAITPLEAAVLSGDVAMLALLLKSGAALDEAMRRRLICLATRDRQDAIAAYLAGRGAAAPAPDSCEGMTLPEV
ncbi:MAG: hypothetical protein ACRD26_24730 [Vicinamibacterales bacterium]